MSDQGRQRRALRALLPLMAATLLAPAGASGLAMKPRLLAKVGYGTAPIGFARTADGALHVVFETNTSWGDSASGVGALSISPSGHVGPQVQALSWGTPGAGSPNGIPGLAVLSDGTLEATFGGSPTIDDGPWGINSSDGGATWTAPADIGSGSMEFGDSAVRLAISKGTPVIAAGCCGAIVIQQGFGPGSNTFSLTNSADNAAGNTDTAVDAATGAVIAGWGSNAGSGGLWLQQAAPTTGAAVKAPVPSQYHTSPALILAGRDTGSGVFAAYPADFGNTSHMRLLRYGGGSVAVGSIKGLHAASWGVGTGPSGRIWVMWAGEINGKGVIAITRSNKAVTRFEPVVIYRFDWASLFSLAGDGRLGPLDLLMSGLPAKAGAVGGIYNARALPVLSAGVTVKNPSKGHFTLKITVTDAGDALKGATVTVKGKTAKTNASGTASITLTGSAGQHVTLKVTAPTYQVLKQGATL